MYVLQRILCILIAAAEVYSFSLFTDEFCDQLTAELDHIEASPVPKGRPNSMNNYGVSMWCIIIHDSLVYSGPPNACVSVQYQSV